eukprot:TRINITY_DN6284_c0_g1_i8.p1 TRINITY_DN6284_c0_g1~~TRINITY_DN6284_c0_g1_i8.p1  ORF type:complete len:103 (-),score=5.00 TRINITY_DN6284_c0_g1_i8:164-472(-)
MSKKHMHCLFRHPCNIFYDCICSGGIISIIVVIVLMSWGAKINSLIDGGEFWRLVKSFLPVDIAHLLVNCYSLNAVGPIVERISGPKRFLTVYFTSAIASNN